MTYDTSLGCLIGNKFHVLQCMVYLEDEPTDVFIVNLKTGEVQEIKVKIIFFENLEICYTKYISWHVENRSLEIKSLIYCSKKT